MEEATVTKPKSIKCVVIGNCKSGKTSIVREFMDLPFKKRYYSTIGFEYSKKELFVKPDTGASIVIYDMSGSIIEHPNSIDLYVTHLVDVEMIIYVFDVSDATSLSHIYEWTHICDKLFPNAIRVLVANKTDLERGITQEVSITIAAEHGYIYEETCASNGEGITELFRTACKHVLKKREEPSQPEDSIIHCRRRSCSCDVM